jgi:ribonuclease T2
LYLEQYMKNIVVGVFAAASFVFVANSAAADVPLTGSFVAHQACPAVQSIKMGTNNGNVSTEPNHSYALLAKNKPDASHYLIEITGADPSRRWVSVTCGERMVSADDGASANGANGSGGSSGAGGPTSSRKPAYVLAVSWQPAFCEQHRDKTECQTQNVDRFDATHFTLHGLWPQPKNIFFCHVSPELVAADKNMEWNKLPAPNLSASTRKNLDEVMPGTMSFLERHEWIKHGTCFQGETADAYFSRAVALMAQLNNSKARELFASHVGSEITGAAIKEAFNASFGDGAGDRVRVACKRDGTRNLIVELTIGLVGEINDDPSLSELVAASEPTDPGCPRGLVDTVGAH